MKYSTSAQAQVFFVCIFLHFLPFLIVRHNSHTPFAPDLKTSLSCSPRRPPCLLANATAPPTRTRSRAASPTSAAPPPTSSAARPPAATGTPKSRPQERTSQPSCWRTPKPSVARIKARIATPPGRPTAPSGTSSTTSSSALRLCSIE